MTIETNADTRYREIESLAREIMLNMQHEVDELGFTEEVPVLIAAEKARYHLQKDPFDGKLALVGEWFDDRGLKKGSLLFHADGSFFVEQDLIRAHPHRERCFVEGINAWGKNGTIKTEAKLLELP